MYHSHNYFFSLALAVVFVIASTFATSVHAMEFRHGGASSACRDKDTCHFWVKASGEITASTAKGFLDYINHSKYTYSTIRFDSLGGDLRGAIRLGLILREKGFNTEAEICASACLYAFLGGATRTAIGKHPQLGIHRFYREKAVLKPKERQFTGEDLDITQRLMAGLLMYTRRMGVDLQLISLSVEAGPNEMRWLSLEEADSLKVTYVAGKWLPWKIEVPQNNKGLIAISETQDKSKSMQLACHSNGLINFTLIDQNGDVKWFELCKNEQALHPILGNRIASKDVQVINNPPGLSFRIQNRSIDFSRNPSLFSGPGSNYSMGCTDLNDSYVGTRIGFQRMASLALSNCID